MQQLDAMASREEHRSTIDVEPLMPLAVSLRADEARRNWIDDNQSFA